MDFSLLSKDNRDNFIEANKNFIFTAAQGVCRRKLTWENDEELSVALVAFNQACDTFDGSKSSFPTYANAVIRNALIDFFRQGKYTPVLIFEDEEEKSNYIDEKNSLTEFQRAKDNKSRAEEIMLFSEELKKYKLDFNDLVKASPSHKDTRNNLLNLAFLCSKEKTVTDYIKEKRLLPVKEIMAFSDTKRKFIEKWRKYLLTLILILTGSDYPYIKSYLNIKAGDKND